MSLADFFAPISNLEISNKDNYLGSQLGRIITSYTEEFPDLYSEETKPHLVIIGVEEDRASVGNNGCSKAPNAVRRHLYELYQGDYSMKITDLGNIKAGATISDTYTAVRLVVEELLKHDILPILLGGGQDLTYAQYL